MIRENSNQALILPGTTSAPGLAFHGNQNTGIFQSDKNKLSIVINGVEIAEFAGSSITFNTAFSNSTSGVNDADILNGFTTLSNNFAAGVTLLNGLGF